MWYGDSVPQNGHTSFSFAGFHSACAPQAGHSIFWRAETEELTSMQNAEFRMQTASV